jgi:hypothetical protein
MEGRSRQLWRLRGLSAVGTILEFDYGMMTCAAAERASIDAGISGRQA